MTSKDEQDPVRRLRALRSVPAERPSARETAASVLPGLPRVGSLDALLREVDGLRLSLETDLSLAAAAVEAGAPRVAADIIDSDREGLAAFEQRALGHLADLAAPPAAVSRRAWWTRVSAAPFVAAAAIVGFLVGVVPTNLDAGPSSAPTTSNVAATSTLNRLQAYVAEGKTKNVRMASETLHEQLATVIAMAKTNPQAAKDALFLLSNEQTAILGSANSAALADVLARSAALTKAIRAALPAEVRKQVPTTPALLPVVRQPAPEPKSSPAAKASSQPSAKPSPSPSAQPTTQPSPKPSPSATPAPSSSPSGQPGGVLPTDPAKAP